MYEVILTIEDIDYKVYCRSDRIIEDIDATGYDNIVEIFIMKDKINKKLVEKMLYYVTINEGIAIYERIKKIIIEKNNIGYELYDIVVNEYYEETFNSLPGFKVILNANKRKKLDTRKEKIDLILGEKDE